MLGWQGDEWVPVRQPSNAHEAKMANIFNGWRFRVLMLITLVLPIAIRVVMTNPEYAVSGGGRCEAVHLVPNRLRHSPAEDPHADRHRPRSCPSGVCWDSSLRRSSVRLHLDQRHLSSFVGLDLHSGRGASLSQEATLSTRASASLEGLDLRGRGLRLHLQHALRAESIHRHVPRADRRGLHRRCRQRDHRRPLLEARYDRCRPGRR